MSLSRNRAGARSLLGNGNQLRFEPLETRTVPAAGAVTSLVTDIGQLNTELAANQFDAATTTLASVGQDVAALLTAVNQSPSSTAIVRDCSRLVPDLTSEATGALQAQDGFAVAGAAAAAGQAGGAAFEQGVQLVNHGARLEAQGTTGFLRDLGSFLAHGGMSYDTATQSADLSSALSSLFAGNTLNLSSLINSLTSGSSASGTASGTGAGAGAAAGVGTGTAGSVGSGAGVGVGSGSGSAALPANQGPQSGDPALPLNGADRTTGTTTAPPVNGPLTGASGNAQAGHGGR